MTRAFYGVINWLYEEKSRGPAQRPADWVLASVSLLSIFKHVDFPSPRHCIHGKKNELAARQSLYYCAFNSTSTNTVLAAGMWQNGLEQAQVYSAEI